MQLTGPFNVPSITLDLATGSIHLPAKLSCTSSTQLLSPHQLTRVCFGNGIIYEYAENAATFVQVKAGRFASLLLDPGDKSANVPFETRLCEWFSTLPAGEP